jgi:hypothetical protein
MTKRRRPADDDSRCGRADFSTELGEGRDGARRDSAFIEPRASGARGTMRTDETGRHGIGTLATMPFR